MQNPFANVAAPPDPDELEVPEPELEPAGPAPHVVATTSVAFPVVLTGASGQMDPIDVTDLAAPAEHVAQLVEAIQDALTVPTELLQLQALVAEANVLQVIDKDTRRRASEIYELLAQNEKGIELKIGPVVAFFHRPWKAMTEFRARFAKPVLEAKKILSDAAGAWDVAEARKAREEQRAAEENAKREEQARLQKQADAAKAAGDMQTAAVVQEMVKEVTAPALPMPAWKPAVATKSRVSYVPVIVDEDAFYKALAADPTLRIAAPIDVAYLTRQAKDFGKELGKRFPGVEAREKGGLSASGK